MIRKIQKYFIKYYFFKVYFFLKNREYNGYLNDLNFLNNNFDESNELKKIFLSDKYLNNKIQDERSYPYHSFDWLKTSKDMGGANNLIRTKKHLIFWSENKYKKKLFVWHNFLVSKRFINLIYNYDFYAISASTDEKNKFDNLVLEHFILLELEIKNKTLNLISIEEYKAFALGSLIYNKNIKKLTNLLINIISFQIDKNGFHKSYNPLKQAEFINNLYEIRNIFLFYKITIPNEITFQILNMSSLLLSLLHQDGSIALFNGSNNFYNKQIINIIKIQSDIKPKNLVKIKNGIGCYGDKNKKFFIDIVKPTNNIVNDNFHASTLGIEMSALGEKIITNCGSVVARYGIGPEYLRYSAAHSTIILNNTNISELIEKKSYKRIPKNIYFNFFEDTNKVIWETSHDGYLINFQKIIKRKIEIFKKQNKFSGIDEILSTKANSKKSSYSIRFHLMPDCSCLITNDQKTVLIKTKLKNSWVFKAESKIKIEESIYMGGGKRVEKNKQIVIYGSIQQIKKTERWSIESLI